MLPIGSAGPTIPHEKNWSGPIIAKEPIANRFIVFSYTILYVFLYESSISKKPAKCTNSGTF